MGRIVWPTLLGLLVGCRAPMPTLDSLQPYDASRVPPPATGSYGRPGADQQQYYPGPTEMPPGPLPGVSVGVRPTSAVSSEPAGSGAQPALRWQSAPGTTSSELSGGNALPSRTSSPAHGMEPGGNETPIRIVEGGQVPAEPPALRGMPANDLTVPEPARFEPEGRLLEISQLPAAPSTR